MSPWPACAVLALAASLGACKSHYVAEANPMPTPPQASEQAPAESPPQPTLRRTNGDPAPTISLDNPTPAPAAPAPTAAPAQAPSGATTMNGHPNGLRRDVVNSAIQGAMGTIASCFSPSAQNPMVAVSFEADPSGRASLVRVDGAPGDSERCIRQAIENVRLPRFEGNGVRINLPLSFHQQRIEQSVPAAAPQPTEAPLFINP